MHYWISYVPSRKPIGPGGHNNLSTSVLEGLLHFISPFYGQNLCLFWSFITFQVTMLYLFSAKQYCEPNVPVEVVTTYSNINI